APDGAPPAKRGLDGQVVRDGDRVAATGTLLKAPGEPLQLCQTNPTIEIHPPPAPTCSEWTVEVDDRAVPDSVPWQQTDGVRHTEGRYTVTGTWRDGRIVRPSVEPAPKPPQNDPTSATGPVPGAGQPAPTVDGEERFPMSCPAPAGGWRVVRVDPQQAEAARNALAEKVSGDPEQYSGMWVAYPEPGIEVMVVGTVGDPAKDQTKLAEGFPYHLCVMRVEHSAAELNSTSERLATSDGRWQTEVWPDRAKVVVRLRVFDQAARDRVGDDADKVIVKPFVHRA
ncbi:MAG: hypothetical protein ACRDUA_18530, partial [Micromonosporaceae bacterium]